MQDQAKYALETGAETVQAEEGARVCGPGPMNQARIAKSFLAGTEPAECTSAFRVIFIVKLSNEI